MAKLAEGNRVYTAVYDEVVHQDDINEWQDQLKAMMGPRILRCTRFGSVDHSSSSVWQQSDGSGLPWRHVAGAADSLFFGIPVYAGQVITGAYVEITGDSAAGAGEIEFVYGTVGSSFTVVDLAGIAHPWVSSTMGYGDAVMYSQTTSPFPLTVAADMTMFFRLLSSSDVTNCYVWDVYVIAQNGN